MHIRPATPEDRPAIIQLLRQSLGESKIPKSEALWRWKHEENPFGPSFVLLAEENNTLIGLRAFMQWDWQWKGTTYKAIRAVDTATHPEHQGKGIFKKLTLQQVEACKQQGVHFVFNTPNEQSRPGYLKMGWVAQGKMPLKFKLLRPFSLAYNKFFKPQKWVGQTEDPSPQQEWQPQIATLLKTHSGTTDQMHSVLSPEYINWRYARNPLFRYNYFTDHENFLVISRIKNYAFAKELRLTEYILLNPHADARQVNAAIKKAVLRFCKDNQVDFISLSGEQYGLLKPYAQWMGILPVKPLGPIVTLRDLNMNEQFTQLLDTQNWAYSLGDLELF